MSVLRLFGLIFFMTILVGGCIASLATYPPPPPTVSQSPEEIPWDEAVQLLNQGSVTNAVQMNSLRVYLVLKNGTTRVTTQPYINAIHHEISSCGLSCGDILLVQG